MVAQAEIRELEPADCAQIEAAFQAQGWHKPAEQYLSYLEQSRAGARTVLLVMLAGQFAGYVTIVWESDYPPFRTGGIPEIVDFNVLLRYRRQGLGTLLMDEAERRIARRATWAGLGVVPLEDYGAAHILYIRRGYVPDGRGLFQRGRLLGYGDQATVDDDLVLHLVKQLTR